MSVVPEDQWSLFERTAVLILQKIRTTSSIIRCRDLSRHFVRAPRTSVGRQGSQITSETRYYEIQDDLGNVQILLTIELISQESVMAMVDQYPLLNQLERSDSGGFILPRVMLAEGLKVEHYWLSSVSDKSVIFWHQRDMSAGAAPRIRTWRIGKLEQ